MTVRHLLISFLIGISFACSTEKDYLVKIETRYGDMYAILYDDTPAHKKNFIELAKDGRYDSTEFHRVIEDFMIQAGDVFTKEGIPSEEWYTIPAEFSEEHIHERGAIAAARQGDGINPQKRSSGSQFYIALGVLYDEKELKTNMQALQKSFMQYLQLGSNKDLMQGYSELYQNGDFKGMNKLMLDRKDEIESFFNTSVGKSIRDNQLEAYTTVGGTPHLDDEYTVFGKVISGLDVVDAIASVQTANQDKPIDAVYLKVTVEEKLKKDITNEFGYIYPIANE